MEAHATFNAGPLQRAARLMMLETGRGAVQVVQHVAKLVVKDSIKLTPPFDSGTTNESFAAQKRQGKQAIVNDVNAVFKSVEEIDMIAAPKNEKLGRFLRLLIERKEFQRLERILVKLKFIDPKIVPNATEKHLKSQKNSRGRIGRQPVQRFVTKVASIKRLVNQLAKRLGTAKHGWPAEQAGVKIPAWIKRQRASQHWRAKLLPKDPQIDFGNKTPFIQRRGSELYILARVARRRAKLLQKETANIVRRAARKANA